MISHDANVQALIKKICKGKKYIKLIIGTYVNNKKSIHVFNETGEIPNENDTYAIGSVTKTFVGALLAKYVYEGKMSLDDPISKYISGLDGGECYPTLKRLATHTSGYPVYLGANVFKAILDEVGEEFGIGGGYLPYRMDLKKMTHLVQRNKRKDMDYPWKYSNFNYALLGYAIGIASGAGYWRTMDDFLSNDLGLAHSYTGIKPQNLHGFNWRNKDIGNWSFDKNLMAPCGDISATTDDLLTYAKINMYEERPYLALSHEKHVASKHFDMGLGWFKMKGRAGAIFHTGETSTLQCWLMIEKSHKCAFVIMSNYDCGKALEPLGLAVGQAIDKLLNVKPKEAVS